MGFFDSVLEEKPQTISTSSPISSSDSFSSGTKKDNQDGSFLIVNNCVTVDNIPDTAVQIFNEPVVEKAPSSEISFFSEPIISKSIESVVEDLKIVEDISSTEIAFFDEPVVNTEKITTPEITITPVDSMVSIGASSPDILSEVIPPLVLSEAITQSTQEEIKTPDIIVVPVKKESVAPIDYIPENNDIYAPMKRAIIEYDAILIARTQISDAIDNKITEHNARIAEEKAAAKKALEERKAIETGTEQIKQMRDTLVAQIK